MKFNEFCRLIIPDLTKELENHEALLVFAQQRAKFEGWLKVELCKILLKHFPHTIPEKGRIDLVAGEWAIELKTFSTNYRYKGVINKTRPITDNVSGVLKDINKLKKTSYKNKVVIFIVFPLDKNRVVWEPHLMKIRSKLAELDEAPFKFSKSIPGIIYIGKV